MRPTRKPRSAFRPLLLGVIALVILAVAGIVVAAAALDPARLAESLKDAVYRSTGRELTVAGGVHLRIGLSPRFEVDAITLANVPGAAHAQMLTAKSLTAQLALLPLLGGDAVISSLTLQDADLVLERGADGAGNWQFAPERRPMFGGGGGGASHGGGGRVEIRTVMLNGGEVTWAAGPGPDVTFGITHLRWSAEGMDLPMKLEAQGTRGGVAITLRATAGSLQRLQGGPVSALAGAWPLTADVAMQGGGIHVEGGINHPEQRRSYQFRITANAPALAALDPLLASGSLPPLSDVNATALVSDGSQGELRTSQVSIHAGAGDLNDWVPGLAIKQVLLSAPGPGQLVQVALDGTYQQQPLRLAGTAMQPDVVGGTGPIQATLSAQAAGASLSAHGTVPPSLTTGGLDIAVTMRAADLASLSPLIGRALPPAKDFTLEAQLGDAGVKLRGIAMRNLVVGSSLGDIAGQITVQWAPREAVTGTLTSRVLDLDAIGAPTGGLLPAVWPLPDTSNQEAAMPAAPNAATPADGQALPADTLAAAGLPLARLRNTDADLTLSIGDLTAGGQKFSDLQAHLQLTDGKLALNPFRAQSAEGAIIGGASLDASSDEPPLAVTLRSPAISAGAVAGLLGYPGGAHGTMQVDAQLSGVGQTVQALKSTLGGHLGVAMVSGEVDDSLVQGLLGAALDTAGVPSFGGGTSQVRCFAMRMDFTNGTGHLRVLAADTSRLALDGTGEIDLRDRTADLHLRPRLRLGPTELAAPVWLHGPFDSLKGTLDPVLGGGRVGMSIGSAPAGPSGCGGKLSIARGGLGGPLPVAAAQSVDPGLVIRKPKDLLKGLFH